MDYRLKNQTERRLYVAFCGGFRRIVCHVGYRAAARGEGFLFEEALEQDGETAIRGMSGDTRFHLQHRSRGGPKLCPVIKQKRGVIKTTFYSKKEAAA